jgi:myo-inositol-1(or 4)-monophosphatase
MDFSDTTAFALSVAREAADLAMRILPEAMTAKDIRHKGPRDLVTRADHEVERLITARVRTRFPDHGILAEEGTAVSGDARWIVDPIDGTTNFAHGVPMFAVSIGYEERGALRCGVVVVPPLGEFFVAERGLGAFLIVGSAEPQRLATSRVAELSEALIATGLPGEPVRSVHVATIPSFMRDAQEVRIMGTAAAHLAYVAAGWLDAFWEPGLNPWDVAAGILLVEEAGGRVSDFKGRPMSPPGGDILATNGPLHTTLLERVSRRA